jgi:DNA-binding GntR family transcriptional regulator
MTTDGNRDRPDARLRRSTITDTTTEAVRSLLLSGEFKPGDPLRQDRLASRLGVSRTPLREALHRLSAEGFVRLDPHRGAVVAEPSPQELLELYEIREAVEVLAVRAAASRCSPADIDDLDYDLDAMRYITDARAWGRANGRFHQRVFALSGKPQLCDLISQLVQRAELYVMILASSGERTRQANHEHEDLVAALRAADADRAEAVTRIHLRATVAQVSEIMMSGEVLGRRQGV